jgi:RNA polymerase sigma-70 factor, ECF subfamily
MMALDPESTDWLASLRAQGADRDKAIARLQALLHGVARAEAARRRDRLPPDLAGDLDDLCLQASHDATLAVLRKLDDFRGASRFTTWAYKFAIFEISVRLRRRAWSKRRTSLDEASWGRLADPAPGPARSVEEQEFLGAVRNLVDTTLTKHQRQVFLAVVGEDIPIDVLAERLASSRGAVYKTLHDARRKLRDGLALAGLGGER